MKPSYTSNEKIQFLAHFDVSKIYCMSHRYWANSIFVHKRVQDGNPYSFMYSNFWTRTRLCTQSWPNIGDSYGMKFKKIL